MATRITFQKAIVPTRKIGRERLTPNERRIAKVFQRAIKEVADSLDTSALARAYSGGNFGAAANAFDWGAFGNRMAENRLTMLNQIQQTGVAETRALGQIIGNYAFDVTDQRATAWAAARSGELIVSISDGIRQEVRNIITNSFVNQIPVDEVAREIRTKVGLFPRWANAVDKQYENNVRRFMDDGMERRTAMERAQVLAEKYRDRLIVARSENIARTEIMTAANEGRRISWLQAEDNGLVNLAESSKEWLAEDDACDICLEALDDGPVPAEETFSNGEDMPPAHPSCRCTAVLIPGMTPDELRDSEAPKPERDDDEPQSIPGADQTVEEPVEETQPERPEPFESLQELYGAYGKENLESLATEVEAAREADRASLVPEFLKYDGLPTEVSRERFNEIATENGGILYRGIFGEDSGTKVEQFYSGEMFHGQGAYGDGSYFSDLRETAVAYARNEESIIEAALSPEARTIDINEVMQQQEALREQARQQVKSGDSSFDDMYAYNALFADPGRTASLLGYDAITVPFGSGAFREGETFTVVLNREAVVFAR